MLKSNAKIFKASALTAMLVLFNTSSYAEIYKWRDARGITKYSDTPPPFAFTKASRTEIVNALQAKDVCVLPNTKSTKSVASANLATSSKAQLSIAFNKGSFSPVVASASAQNSTPSLSSMFGRLTGRGFLPASKPRTLASLPSTPVAATPTTAVSAPPKQTLAQTAPTSVVSTPPKQILAQAAPTIAPTTVANTPTTPSTSLIPPNIVQVALMPAVDISKNVFPATGYSEMRIQPTTEQPTLNGGAFRVSCAVSHMGNDDPLVYPNQPGAAHHHTFFGNTSTNAKSDLMTMASTGNSTCNGGTMNRSAYWMPSMIDTGTNTPIKPDGILFYYKTGGVFTSITAPPKGLRMITGNAKGNSAATAKGLYTCITPAGTSSPWQQHVVNCPIGDSMQLHIDFPQCWDGVNLDSPDHKSHMSDRENVPGAPARCPSTHPVMIPAITLNLNYKITSANQTANWRLASDNYATSSPGGYSAHADWVNGWDEKTMAGIVKNCLNKDADCHAHLLGDGRMFY